MMMWPSIELLLGETWMMTRRDTTYEHSHDYETKFTFCFVTDTEMVCGNTEKGTHVLLSAQRGRDGSDETQVSQLKKVKKQHKHGQASMSNIIGFSFPFPFSFSIYFVFSLI